MNNKIAIVTDSGSDIPKSLIEKYNIFVIPLKIICNNTEYRDGIDISYEKVYKLQAHNKILTTSLPDGKDIEQTFENIISKGYNKAIVVTMSSGLSGTYNMINLHKNFSKELEIQVFDSKNCSLGLAMIVLQLAKDLKNQMNFKDLLNKARNLIANTYSYVYVDSLECLQKGGRIGKFSAFTGTVLNIKPVLSLDEKGCLYPVAKIRGRKQGRQKLLELIKLHKSKDYNISLMHGNLSHEMVLLKDEIKAIMPDYNNLWQGHIGGAISVHLGSGVLAVAIQKL